MSDIARKLAEPFLPLIIGDERAALIARFWSQVSVSAIAGECWEWAGHCNIRDGGVQSYGRFTVRGGHIYAHRFSYQLVHGAISDDVIVRHRCDNEPCINPRHLVEGTPADNTRDKFERGRGPDRKGEKHPLARLTEADIREIRRLRSMGITEMVVARHFNVSRGHVYRIISGKNWGHIA